MSNRGPFPSPVGRKLKLAALLIVAAPLAACSTGADRITTSSIRNDDFHARHPIELARERVNLDVLPQVRKGAIDARTQAQVREFAEHYRADGSGDIGIGLPQGPGSAEAEAALPGLRKALVAGGAQGYIVVSHYPVANPTLASPVRLSYASVVARTRSRCGQWPNDLASGSSAETWDNRPWWNFGCASQQMLAAQVAEPRDLLGPSALSPPDGNMRTRGIVAVREGNDPSAHWATKVTGIGGF